MASPGTTSAQRTMRRIVRRRDGEGPVLERGVPPRRVEGAARVRSLLVGIDGTDEDVVEDPDVELPPGADHLVLGHECLGEVVDAPPGSGLSPGTRVVPLVRHACGVCANCAKGIVDMCSSGRYTEHGIRGLDGFLREEWADDPATLVPVPPALGDEAILAEPLSVVVKALEVVCQVQERVPGYGGLRDKRVLLAGTGSLGSLAAFELARAGARTWAYDRSDEDAASSRLLRGLGIAHVDGREVDLDEVAREAEGFDVVIEATGSPSVAFELALTMRENAIACLLGVPRRKPAMEVEAAEVMRELVTKNQCIVGSVNSNARHMGVALERLVEHKRRTPDLLKGVLTHRFGPDEAAEAFAADGPDLIKKAIDWRA